MTENTARGLEKLAAHQAKQTEKRLARQKEVKKLYDDHVPIEEIIKKVGYSDATVVNDLKFLGYKIDRRKVIHHAMIKKWFLDGKAPKEIAADLDVCLKTVYRSVTEQIDKKRVKLQKVKLTYKMRKAGVPLVDIAKELDVSVSTVRRFWDDRIFLEAYKNDNR